MKQYQITCTILALALSSSTVSLAENESSSDVTAGVSQAAPTLPWKVISSGGTDATSAGMHLRGTVGQTAATYSTSGTLILNAGFWQNFASLGGGCCIGNRGDADGNGTDNTVLDMTYIINNLFRGGPASPCPEESDLNSDGSPATILDLTFIINDIYRGGTSPGACP